MRQRTTTDKSIDLDTLDQLRAAIPEHEHWVLDTPIDNSLFFHQYHLRSTRINCENPEVDLTEEAVFSLERSVDLHFALHAIEHQDQIEKHHRGETTSTSETSDRILSRAMELATFVERWYPEKAPLFTDDFLLSHKTDSEQSLLVFSDLTSNRFVGPIQDGAYTICCACTMPI